VRHALQVALVSVHDDDFITLVQLVSHLLTKRFDSSLDESLFGVHIQLTVALRAVRANLEDTVTELLDVIEIFRR
jgi:hypothetical protein